MKYRECLPIKKNIAILLAAVLALTVSGCSNHTPDNMPEKEESYNAVDYAQITAENDSERLSVVSPISHTPSGKKYTVAPNWVTVWTFDSEGNFINEEVLTPDASSGDMDYSSYRELRSTLDYGKLISSCWYGGYSYQESDTRVGNDAGGGYSEYTRYYDGEIEITNNCVTFQTDDMGSTKAFVDYKLVDSHREVILDGYDFLAPSDHKKTPAENFLGVRMGRAELLDRRGNIVTSKELPGVARLFPISDGLYSYGNEDFLNAYFRTGTWWEYTEGLLGPDLEVLIPDGTYIQIVHQIGYAGNDGVPVELLRCIKYVGSTVYEYVGYDRNVYTNIRENYRTDMFTMSGELLVENLTEVYQIGPDRMSVVRGNYAGIMDWNGNWIAKKPIYTEFLDD